MVWPNVHDGDENALPKNPSSDTLHGALLALREILEASDHFMSSHFAEARAGVFKFSSHRDKLVRWTILALMAPLARFCPVADLDGYVDQCISFIDGALKAHTDDRHAALMGLGHLAIMCSTAFASTGGVENVLIPRLNKFVEVMQKGLRGVPRGAETRASCRSATRPSSA